MYRIEEIKARWMKWDTEGKIGANNLQSKIDIFILLAALDERDIYIHQLRGALGYPVPGHIRENPDILNGIADALHKDVEAAEREAKELTKLYEQARQDRADVLNVKSKDGLLSSEWLMRTAKAEREVAELQHQLLMAETGKADLTRTNDNLQERIKELEAALTKERQISDDVVKDNQILKGRVTELEADRETLIATNNEKVRENERLRAEIKRINKLAFSVIEDRGNGEDCHISEYDLYIATKEALEG